MFWKNLGIVILWGVKVHQHSFPSPSNSKIPFKVVDLNLHTVAFVSVAR